VEVIDSVQDYLQLMKEIFDFAALKTMITGAGGAQKVNLLVNPLSGGACSNLCVCVFCYLSVCPFIACFTH